MHRPLDGRVALVTGAGQGVGQGIARALANAGATIVIAQRGVEQGEAEAAHIRDNCNVDATFIRTDVTCVQDVEAMVSVTHARFGRLDVLVNNAGASTPKRLEQYSDEEMAASLDLNFWAAFRAMRAAFPIMKAQGFGRIINLGSLNGVNAHMFTAAYNAAKEALRALSRTAAVEWGRHGITVNVICPAAISPQAQEYFNANPEMLARILDQIPVGRMGDAHRDIGPAAVFLADEGSAYLTGATLFLDGGSHVNGVSWRPVVQD